MKKSILLLTTLLALLLSFLFFLNQEESLDEGRPTSISNRVFSHENLVRVEEFEIIGRITKIYRSSGSIWVVDAATNQISQFLDGFKPGNVLSRSGGAPWENSSIWYFEKVEDGHYILDRPKKMIKKYNLNDSLEYYFKAKDYIDNCSRLADENFLFTRETGNDFQFVTTDIKTSEVNNVQSIKEMIFATYKKFPDRNRSLVFEGNYSRNRAGQSIYYFYKFGYLLLFDSVGNIKHGLRTIDNFELPDPVSRQLGPGIQEESVEPDIFVNSSACMDENNIYILSNIIKSAYKNGKVIDVYSINEGKYLYSFLVPNLKNGEEPTEIAKEDDNKISVLYEDMTISTYEIK